MSYINKSLIFVTQLNFKTLINENVARDSVNVLSGIKLDK
jgi:hypothetical protein